MSSAARIWVSEGGSWVRTSSGTWETSPLSVLTGRHAERLEQPARELGAIGTAAFDATDPDALARFFDSLPGPIDDVMVTGGDPLYGRLLDGSPEETRRLLIGRHVLPVDVARGSAGKLASASGRPAPARSSYHARSSCPSRAHGRHRGSSRASQRVVPVRAPLPRPLRARDLTVPRQWGGRAHSHAGHHYATTRWRSEGKHRDLQAILSVPGARIRTSDVRIRSGVRRVRLALERAVGTTRCSRRSTHFTYADPPPD
jgi:hypothetical protein